MVTVEESCEVVTDGTHYTPQDVGAGIPFLTVKDVSDGGLDFTNCSFISEEDFHTAKRGHSAPQKGDVLFSKDGTVGKVHVVRTDVSFAVLSSLAILRPRSDKVDPNYLGHVLRSPSVLNDALKRKTGSAIRRIILSDLKRVRFPLPSFQEQKRISDILDRAEALRTKRRAALKRSRELAGAIFLEMFGEPLLNPRGFEVSTIGQMSDKVTDGEHVTPKRTTQGIKLLSARNIRDGFIDFTKVDYISSEEHDRIRRRCDPSHGDVLISCSGTIGRVSSVQNTEPFSLVRSVALLRPRKSDVHFKFLEYYLRSNAIQSLMMRRANASGQANLFQGQIRDLPIYLPSFASQARFSRVVANVDRLCAANDGALKQFHVLFASLQQRVFGGAC